MSNMSDIEIKKIVSLYKNQREKDKERYSRIKDTEEFKLKNRARAKAHYEKTKEIRQQRYKDERDIRLAKNTYYYYKRVDKMDLFKEKHSDKYEILKKCGYFSFNDQSPLESITTSDIVYDSATSLSSSESVE
jgi:hypothetical protein